MFLVRSNNWDDAAALWASVLEDPDPKIAGRGAFNMALFLEISGDIDAAIAMADRAIGLLPNANTVAYRNLLEERRYELNKLDQQLGDGT